MKVALCLSGHVRNIELTYRGLKKHILDIYDTDIFLSAWDTRGWRVEGQLNSIFKGFDYFSEKVNQQQVIDLLKPKSYFFENYTEHEHWITEQSEKYKSNLRVPDRDRPANSTSAWYKIYNCNELKKEFERKNNFKYDLVIRSRFDIEYGSNIIDNPILYNKDDCMFTPYIYSYDLASDILSISSSQNIDKYCELFKNMDLIYHEGCMMNPHNILKHWLDKSFQNKWYKHNMNIDLNRCRKSCQAIVCCECHPENRNFNVAQK